MQIEPWLEKFREAWANHDVDAAMALFAEDVEYWETPFKKLSSLAEVRSEWEGVVNQHDIKVDTRVFSEQDGRYAVAWQLSYRNEQGITRELAGTYLIVLNDSGLCTYFHHTGELKG